MFNTEYNVYKTAIERQQVCTLHYNEDLQGSSLQHCVSNDRETLLVPIVPAHGRKQDGPVVQQTTASGFGSID